MAEDKKAQAAKEGSDAKSEKQEEKVEVPEKFEAIVKQIEEMSVLDLAELVKILEDKFGVSAAAPVAVAGVAAGGEAGGEDSGAEKSEYDVELVTAGDSKIGVIKAVKEITGAGLKEAKDMVDGAPTVIKEKVAKEEAEEMKKKLGEAGATVELK